MADLIPHSIYIDRLQKEGELTWLHLSDIHFGGPDADGRPAVLNRLLKDVEERKTKDGLTPDLVFITGDIAWSGKAEQYKERALPFLEELQARTGVERYRIFLIPGNHDVDRDLIAGRGAKLLAEDLLAEGSKEEEKAISTFLYGNDAEDRERLFKKHSAYIDFVKAHFPHCEPLFDPCAYVAKVTVPAGLPFEKLWVLGLNSAWLSRKHEENGKEIPEKKGQLLLGYPQVLKALNFIESEKNPDKDFVFALTHHPLSWMADWDERLCKQQLAQRTDFHLSGHLHEHAFSLNAVGPQRYSSIAAGSVYGDGGMQWYNGYYFARMDFTTGKARTYIRQFNPNADKFVVDATYETPNVGEFEWLLPERLRPKNPPPAQPQPAQPAPVQPAPVTAPPAARVEIPQERGRLILFLDKLTLPQFEKLLLILDPPLQYLPGPNSELSIRVAGLVRWAEGIGGCGLEAIRNALNQIFNP